MADYPILEHDPDPHAVINPRAVLKPIPDFPERVVLCFFAEVLAKVCAELPIIKRLGSEIGKNPIYRLDSAQGSVAVLHPGVGAPLAAAFLEECIALGGRRFIACGGAGVLDSAIGVGHVLIPDQALRDEGTSYHYLPPSRTVRATPEAVQAIAQVCARHGIPHDIGTTWTTDGLYRETPARVAARRAEGARMVEMEAAAFFAVAQFRGVRLGQLLYGGDDVSSAVWDSRDWHKQADTRTKLFWVAVEAALSL